jgi:hypothetical protein
LSLPCFAVLRSHCQEQKADLRLSRFRCVQKLFTIFYGAKNATRTRKIAGSKF